jgi:3-oxosteroid 1-dehydrogenase
MMVVNKAGKRVYNEKATYNERAKVHFNIATDPDGPNYTNRVLISIYDNFTHHTQTFNTPPYGGAEMIRGENRTHLAQMIRARLETLKNFTGQFQLGDDFEENLNQTWDRYNQFAITGVDKDFGRGKSPTDVEWDAYLYQVCLKESFSIEKVICNQLGQPCNYTNPRPNPTMRELHYEGPYYAMIITAGLQDTKGGPMINENSQVMDMWGDPINGLYGAGNAVGVAVKIAYPAPGATIGNALIFGYKAGKHAAAQPNFP